MSNRFSLDHLSALEIQGPDAHAYANAQFTVSVGTLSDTAWSPLAWCDPKGRVLSVMMARASENSVELVLPSVQAGEIGERLGRFTIGRRASVSPPVDLAGSFAPDPDMPALSFDTSRGMRPGLTAGADPEARDRWRRLDLCCGLPWLEPASSGKHLPQWLGLEALDALAFDKGCYPGQEVVARLHYRGSVKYRLQGLRINAPIEWRAGAPLVDAAGHTVGRCLGGARDGERSIGLAVLGTGVAEGDELGLDLGGRSHAAHVTVPEALC
jgi:folate-binding protein YgfZ